MSSRRSKGVNVWGQKGSLPLAVSVRCPHCGENFLVEPIKLGKTIQCPRHRCRRLFVAESHGSHAEHASGTQPTSLAETLYSTGAPERPRRPRWGQSVLLGAALVASMALLISQAIPNLMGRFSGPKKGTAVPIEKEERADAVPQAPEPGDGNFPPPDEVATPTSEDLASIVREKRVVFLPPADKQSHNFKISERRAPDGGRTVVELVAAVDPTLSLDCAFSVDSKSQKPPIAVYWSMLSYSKEPRYSRYPLLRILVDGVYQDFGKASWTQRKESGHVIERVSVRIPVDQFVRAVKDAKFIEGSIGPTPFRLNADHVVALRDFARRIPVGSNELFEITPAEKEDGLSAH